MVVALCATVASDEQARGELADLLGDDPVSAPAFAVRLLADPHPLVAAGARAWVRPARETTRIKRWRAELPAAVVTGAIPSQEEIDRCAAERTLGLIERIPVDISEDVVCLLATALAARVSWEVPFEVVDAAALGPSRWPAGLPRVLRPPRRRRSLRRPPVSRQSGPQRLARAASLLSLGERTHRRRTHAVPLARVWPSVRPGCPAVAATLPGSMVGELTEPPPDRTGRSVLTEA